MDLYLAPLEGITGYVFRMGIEKIFGGGVNKYFAPFLEPHSKRGMSKKELRELSPENNQGIYLVPQILTKSAQDFLAMEDYLYEAGFTEVNINLGCPSQTVVSKGKGAGFLKYPRDLDLFLQEIFRYKKGKISLKTRLGVEDSKEFEELLAIYNRYPIEELIIHPRLRSDYYKNSPRMESFFYAVRESKNPLSYNGDIYSVDDYKKLLKEIEKIPEGKKKVRALMLGRGVVADPSLIRQISGGQAMSDGELLAFLQWEEEEMKTYMSGDRPPLFHLKELWTYLQRNVKLKEKDYKKILKSKTLKEYHKVLDSLILQGFFRG